MLVAAAALFASRSPADIAPPQPTPQFRSYSLGQGLPSSEVHAVAQDRTGYIWVGTAAGLARFDGVEFEVHARDVSRPGSLPSNRLSTVFVDAADQVWTGGKDTGLNRYDASAGTFRQWHHDPAAPGSLSEDHVTAIAQTRDGAIWVGTARSGLQRLRKDENGFDRPARELGAADGPPTDAIRSLFATADGGLLVGSDAGLERVGTDGRIRRIVFENGVSPRVNRIDGDEREVRIATDIGLYRLVDGMAYRDMRIPAVAIDASLSDTHGMLWIATAKGLHVLDRYGRLDLIEGAWTAKGGLPGRTVRQIMEDREHGVWFALSDGGLAYLGPSWDDFTRFTNIFTDTHGLPGLAATAVAARGDDKLWIGGLRGWIRLFDPATGAVERACTVGSVRVEALRQTDDGRLWVGTSAGLYLYDKRRVRRVAPGQLRGAVTGIVTRGDGTLYVASSIDGVFEVDTRSLTATPLFFQSPRRGQNETRELTVVQGRLWQASSAGLARLDDATGQMRFVDGVAPGRANAVELDEEGFWLARPDALEHYRWKGEVAMLDRSIAANEGWPSPDVLGLRLDALGRLWIYAHTGAWRFDPSTSRFRTFGIADGLASVEFTAGATVKLRDGTVYGTTLGGVVGFRPDRQSDHVKPPPVLLVDASVARDGSRIAVPLDSGTLVLRWDDRDLRIRARTLSYSSPARNWHEFALTNRDGARLSRTGPGGVREFEWLAPGFYSLHVRGGGGDSDMGELAKPLTIIVDAPPWNRWWAWTLYLACGLALMLGFATIAHQRQRRAMTMRLAQQQSALAVEASQAKTEFMATLGHELRTPMTGVLGMAELLAQTPLDTVQHGYVDAVRRSGTLLLRLINETLDLTRIEARRLVLESECLPVRATVREVVDLAAAAAREKHLVLDASVAGDVPERIRGDATRIRQILQNLLNNAVKFTDRGGIAVAVSRQAGHIVFDVSDTGPGLSDELRSRLFRRFEQGASPQRKQGAGLGLAICRELTTLMGGSIEVDSALGRGSRFRVRLPLTECTCVSPAPALPSCQPVPGRRLRVLLVEDDATVAEVIVELLRRRGHEITHASDGLAGLTELSCRPYDLMLLDLDLPGIDGFEVARMVRRMDGMEQLPIVAVSARSVGDEASATRAAGINGFVRKPMSGADLDAVLEAPR